MATYSLNYEQNGVEISFDTKPNLTVLEDLKRNGWHWNGKKKVWYKRQSAESIAFAKKLCNQNDVKTIPANAVPFNFTDYFGKRHDVTVEKNKTGYSITSTTNMILCVDCNKIYSIHASACPFCGCPLHYTADNYYIRFANQQQKIYRQEEQERKRKEKAELAQKAMIERAEKERKERERKEKEERERRLNRQKTKEEEERLKEIRQKAKKEYELMEKARQNSQRILSSFGLDKNNSTNNNRVYDNNTKKCMGNCSVCTRDKCIEDL